MTPTAEARPLPTVTPQPQPPRPTPIPPTLLPTATPTPTLEPPPIAVGPAPEVAIDDGLGPEPPPSELAFVGNLVATRDEFILAPGLHQLRLLDNDVAPGNVQLSIVDPSATNDLTIDDAIVTVEIPEDQIADVAFTYVIASGDATASAEVSISVVHLGSVAAGAVSDASTAASIQIDEEPADGGFSLGPIDFDLQVPPAIVALTELRMPWLQFLATFVTCMLALFALRRRNARTGFVAVDNVARQVASRSTTGDGDFYLRHDTEGVWVTGRRRDDRIEIQTPNGQGWVAESDVSKLE